MKSAFRLGALCALCFRVEAAILSVSASASEGPADFALHSDFESASAVFRVLVTGGSGSGVFSPDITLQGTTNESEGVYLVLGGSASTTWPQNFQVGDPTGPATVNPMFSCSF